MPPEVDEATKGTALPGSEPGKDGKASGAEPEKPAASGAGSAAGEDGEKLPFDQHPKWQSARKAEKTLQDLMEANELETVEDLVALVQSGQAMKGKAVTEDALDKLLEKAATLDKYEAYWKEQEELRRREEETPEQTIARLEKEKVDLQNVEKRKDAAKQKANEAKQLWNDYDKEVLRIFEELKDVPAELRKMYAQHMGVDNPASKIDFTDKKAIRAAANEARKRVDAIMDFAVKQYIAGKREIPVVPGSGGAGDKPTTIKNLRDARRVMVEHAGKFK